jgi:hypothetical protein
MKAPVIVTVNVYDESPSDLMYRILIQFDPIPERNWTIETTKKAAEVWAEKLLAVDGSLRPGWCQRMRYEALPALANQILSDKAGHYVGAGTSVYIDQAPIDSRLHNRFQLNLKLQMLRNELALQVPV